ncbi:MAG: hypothetical protein P4N59_19595 [Negativicutes bacterium]|nr:hypothetical protein [Negativicutes bacterium]
MHQKSPVFLRELPSLAPENADFASRQCSPVCRPICTPDLPTCPPYYFCSPSHLTCGPNCTPHCAPACVPACLPRCYPSSRHSGT